jgi:NitT/TauT family transport system substrate-binding protein
MKEGDNMKYRIGFLAAVSSCALLVGLAGVSSAQTNLTTVKVGLGYIADVQFAPFYAAQEAGFYKAKGLNVTFQHGFTSELYPLLASGKLDFVVGDAEDVILLRTKDPKATPFKYLMALYQVTPNALFSKREKNITKLADLKGKSIGIPGKFGSSWTSLQALLAGANLKETDVKIVEVGFTQLEALTANRVDAVMGFVNNEAVIAEAKGLKLNIFSAAVVNKSPSNGVIAVDDTLKNEALVKGFLEASQLGVKLTIDNTKQAFDYAKKFVPNMSGDRLKILEKSVKLYQSNFSKAPSQGIGFSNPNNWEYALALLKSVGRIDKDAKLKRSEFYTNKYLTSGIQAAK